MIRHICKLLWNERRANGWILFEYILVFTVLWFCCDFLYQMAKFSLQPIGFDIENTYSVQMQEVDRNVYLEEFPGEINEYELAMSFIERAKRHPDVEAVSFSIGIAPYIMGGSTGRGCFVNGIDSVWFSVKAGKVTPDFFKVFNLSVDGQLFNWPTTNQQLIICPGQNKLFGEKYPVEQVHSVQFNKQEEVYQVIGRIQNVKEAFFDRYESCALFPLDPKEINLGNNRIAMRVKPGTPKDFEEHFVEEMTEQLSVGPYLLAGISPLEEAPPLFATMYGITGATKNVYAITLFVIINIFLGVIGTFWYRTQSRQSEIGLRVAMGSTRRQIKAIFLGETFILLFIASIIGLNICLNIANSDSIEIVMPVMDAEYTGRDWTMDLINFGLAFTILALISAGAVWYPASKAADIPPAEALRNE